MSSNKTILKNTLFLYTRQIIIILITLYSLRVVLNGLGVDDYGVYSVITGFVTLLAFLPGSMASATQRFFSFAIGKNDEQQLKQIFSMNLLLYIVIAVLAYVILQTVGNWYITEHLKIANDRFDASLILYRYTTLAFVLSVFTAPFIAILIAHEDMHWYAIISVIDAVLKLAVALSLAYINMDLLEYYGAALLAATLLIAFVYLAVCFKKYTECQLTKLYWSTSLLKEILGFTIWTLLGQVSTAFRNQAVTVLVNQMFNPAIVAARAIAINVASQVAVFSNQLNTGLYPPIIKSYAANQLDEMKGLVFNGSKLTFFLMWVFALPMLLEMQAILTLWLKTPPAAAVLFTRLAIVETLIFALSMPLATAARAPGKMALYEIILGSIQISIFFVSWWVLTLGYSAEWVFYIAIAANVVMFKIRLLLVSYLTALPVMPYYKQVVWPLMLVLVFSAVPSMFLANALEGGLLVSAGIVVFSGAVSTVSMYYFGLDKVWRAKVINLLRNKFLKQRKAV